MLLVHAALRPHLLRRVIKDVEISLLPKKRVPLQIETELLLPVSVKTLRRAAAAYAVADHQGCTEFPAAQEQMHLLTLQVTCCCL